MEENKEEIIKEENSINENNNETVSVKNSGLSIASMVLGIVALVCLCSWLMSTVCGILAVVFGAKELKKSKQPMAKAGLIMGIIALSIVAFYLICACAFGLGFSTVFI